MNELFIFGDIGKDWWTGDGVDDKDLLTALKSLDSSEPVHHLHINSVGGSCDIGLTMMNLLLSHKKQMKVINPDFVLKTYVDGYCMSAATLPYMAGDERHVCLGGIIMIHDPWTMAYGNAAEMTKTADRLTKLADNIAEVYQITSKEGSTASWREVMLAETYFTGQEAVDAKLSHTCDTDPAKLFDGLTVNEMKGNYLNCMKTIKDRATVRLPLSPEELLSRKEALTRLELLTQTLSENL